LDDSISLAPERKEWARLRELIEAFSVKQGLSAELSASLQLIGEEWFINIIMHGYKEPVPAEGPSQKIAFSITRQPHDAIRLCFIDHAPPFDPLRRQAANIELPADKRGIGGLGIHLIRSIADECRYARKDGCNYFEMIKKIGE